MGNKTKRLLAIKDIISKSKISGQDELSECLEKLGFSFTQATISRDLKFLKVNKIADRNKGYIYKLTDQHSNDEIAENYAAKGFVSIQFAKGLAVIKTHPGYAPSIASLIDKADPFEIIATIAGDDTVLLIPHNNVSENDVINALILIIPELKNKIG